MWKFVRERISEINIALCYEQTSPLDVLMYAFGFSLSILHYFSAPLRQHKNAQTA